MAPPRWADDLRRFWSLTFTLARTEFKLRFFGSVLGYVWSLVRPLLFFGVLYVFFTEVGHVNDGSAAGEKHYGAQLLASIVLCQFFVEATTGAVRSVVDRENLLRKIHFPRLVIPLSVVLLALFNLALNLIVVLIFALAEGVTPMLSWLELPLIVGALVVCTTGVAMLLAALFVHFRDIQPIWEVIQQILFYASPVIISIETVIKKLEPDDAAHLHAQPAGGDLSAVPPRDDQQCCPQCRPGAGQLGGPGWRRSRSSWRSSSSASGVQPRGAAHRGEPLRWMPTQQATSMSNGQSSTEAENERLRARVAALEEELVEMQARANAAVAKWQERVYWLDRWHLDLNALMRRPGAREFRAGLRAFRALGRAFTRAKRAPDAIVSISAVIPVKDGERYLEELLDALAREGVDEILVIDSGSRDRSREIARAAGVELLEIEPERVRPRPHAQPRRRAHLGRADLLSHAGRDPAPGLARRLPRGVHARPTRRAPPTGRTCRARTRRPMIARELAEFFASFSPDGQPVLQRAATPASSPTSTPATPAPAGRRSASATSPYAEDQAFGADLLGGGLDQGLPARRRRAARARLRPARVHAPLLRRVPRPARDHRPRRAVRRPRDRWHVRRQVPGDRRWMAEQGLPASERARWTARAVAHHGGRRVFSALGSRAESVPAPLRRRLSLEGRDDAPLVPSTQMPSRRRPPTSPPSAITTITRRSRAYGAREQLHYWTPCRVWPSASGCASRWSSPRSAAAAAGTTR